MSRHPARPGVPSFEERQPPLDMARDLPLESVQAEVAKILTSSEFVHADRLRRFVQFTIDHAIRGQQEQLNEYLLALEVFDRDCSYDPRVDSIVRVEAGRLRQKLKKYYASEGRYDPIIIDFPKRSYAPVFKARSHARTWLSRVRDQAIGPTGRNTLLLGCGLFAGLLAIQWSVTSSDPSFGLMTGAAPTASFEYPSSIVVLPFANHSPDIDSEYFSIGLSEEIINALTRVEQLRVVSRSSSFALKGRSLDVREIGKQLNVETVLEGSVRQAENNLRVTVQLSDTKDGFQIWSATYDRELKDVFAVQEEISRAIVSALSVRLESDAKPLVERHTESLKAYNLYLQGRYYWNNWNPQELRKAIESFRAAVEEDPSYALAYAGLADSYHLLGIWHVSPPREVMPRAKEAALKALEIDPDLAEARTSLGAIKASYDWNWKDAEQEFKRAIEINPRYATAHQWYAGFLLAGVGRLDEAIEEMKLALELDPVSRLINNSLGDLYFFAGDLTTAASWYKRTLDLDKDFYRAYWSLGRVYTERREFEQAVSMLTQAMTLSGVDSSSLAYLGYVYGSARDVAKAKQRLTQLDQLSAERYVPAIDFAIIHVGLGDKSRAFEWLDRALQARDPKLIELQTNPCWQPLRSDPRFDDLVTRIWPG